MNIFVKLPGELILMIWRNRFLIKTLIVRDVLGRYKGSFVGIFWTLINPLFLLAIYTFAFGRIFKSVWPGATKGSSFEFALILFSGLMVFNFFSECVSRAPNVITSNVNYVKKVIFPLEILPIIGLGSALFHMIVSFIVWLLFYLFIYGCPKMTLLFFPVLMIPMAFFILGLSWMLSAVGVYFRDLNNGIGIFISSMMFLTPIFYPVNALPLPYRDFLYINPLTWIVENVRNLLVFDISVNFLQLSVAYVLSILFLFLGYSVFKNLRSGFADVV